MTTQALSTAKFFNTILEHYKVERNLLGDGTIDITVEYYKGNSKDKTGILLHSNYKDYEDFMKHFIAQTAWRIQFISMDLKESEELRAKVGSK